MSNTLLFDRDSEDSPDERYDSFVMLDDQGQLVWEIALPDGEYLVRLVAGDPESTDGEYGILAEQVQVLKGNPTPGQHWIDSQATVTVNDGKLSLRSAPGAKNNKLCFIEIQPLP